MAMDGIAHGDAMDGDADAETADVWTRKTGDTLHEGNAARQVAALGEERRERLRSIHGDQVSHFNAWRPIERIESDRCAGGGVPDQPRRDVDEGQAADKHYCEVRRHDVAEAGHGSTFRRRRMARCCSIV